MRLEGSRRFDGSALSPETEEMNWFKKLITGLRQK